jgi:hypothetical protein
VPRQQAAPLSIHQAVKREEARPVFRYGAGSNS